MTTSGVHGVARQQRRRVAQLAVMAGSSVVLAASWVGVVEADRTAPSSAPVPLATEGQVATVAQPGSANPSLVPAPAPAPVQRQVVIRRSRAS